MIKLQRLQADFENYKKRVARTSEEVVTRAVADVVAKLLPVLDALDLADGDAAREHGLEAPRRA